MAICRARLVAMRPAELLSPPTAVVAANAASHLLSPASRHNLGLLLRLFLCLRFSFLVALFMATPTGELAAASRKNLCASLSVDCNFVNVDVGAACGQGAKGHGPLGECKKIRQHFAVGLSFVPTVTWHVFTVSQLAIYGQAKQLPTATSTNDFNNWQQQSSTNTRNMKPHSNAINV